MRFFCVNFLNRNCYFKYIKIANNNKNINMKNIFLYFSAFIPMYFLIIIKFIFGLVSGSIEFDLLTLSTFILFLVLIILGVVGLFWNIFWNKEKSVKIIIKHSHNITDQHFLGYFSLFVLFALTFELTKLSMFIVSIFIIIFIGIVYVNNQMFYINPFLNILGYNFYEITYVKENGTEEKTAKMFYKGILEPSDKPCLVKLKNQHFTFVDKKNK